MTGPAREGDNVADVVHAGCEQYEALKAEAEAGMGHRSVAAQIQVSAVRLQRHAGLLQPRLQHLHRGRMKMVRGYGAFQAAPDLMKE